MSRARTAGYEVGQKRYGGQQQELQQAGAAALPGVKFEGGGIGRPRSRFGEGPPAAPGLHEPFQRPHAGTQLAPSAANPMTEPDPGNRFYCFKGLLFKTSVHWAPRVVYVNLVLAFA